MRGSSPQPRLRKDLRPAAHQPLFTGATTRSRAFELATWAAALASGIALALLHPAAPVRSALAAWPLVIVTAVLGAAGVALGGIYRLPFASKIFLSLGSGAAFALLLVLPAREALAAAFAGAVAAQFLRRRRGDRLSASTMTFNVAQYVVTWSASLTAYALAHAAAAGSGLWVPAAAAGIAFIAVNTWVVSIWSALRRRASARDVWIRTVTEAGAGFAGSLALGVSIAAAAAAHPMYVVAILAGFGLAHVGLLQYQRVALRQNVLLLTAIVDAAERRSPELAEHSERVSWWADRLARAVGLSHAEADQIAMTAKLHDLTSIALGAGNGLTEPTHAPIQADVLSHLPGFAPIARTLRARSESYDGSGPDGVSGTAIPIASRIIAVAEQYVIACATAATPDHALADLRRLAGTRLDPQIVRAVATLTRENVPWRLPLPKIPAARPQYLPAFAVAAASAGNPAFRATWPSEGEARSEDGQPEADTHRIGPATILSRLETEQRRIGRELHDQVGAALTAVKCQLAAARHARTGDQHRVLADTDGLLARTITQVQDLSSTLRPPLLDEDGLVPALASYIARYTRQTEIRVEFTHDELDGRRSPLADSAAYRIVQEALTNVARHAQTDRARVTLRRTGETLTVVVADAGAGFDTRKAGAATGLTGMAERAKLLGGTVTLRSAPGAGTTVEAVLPAGPTA